MNSYDKAQSLGLTGTDSEQVAILQTLASTNIPTQDVRVWFRENRLWMQKPGDQMWGTLEDASVSATSEQRQQLDYLFDAVFGGSSEMIRTSEPIPAGETWAVVQTIVALVPDSSASVDSFYGLGGGRPFAALTVDEFAADRSDSLTQQENQAALDSITVRSNAANEAAEAEFRASGATPASITAAGEAGFAVSPQTGGN